MNVQQIDYNVDLLRAVLWQYDGAPALKSILEQKSQWYSENQEAFWEAWFRDVFDLNTANEFGLQVWARILGLPLQVALAPDPLDKPTWGFGADNQNFTNGNFSTFSESIQNLTTAQKRLVLKLRYIQLVSRGTVPEVNQFLSDLFRDEEGSAYLIDNYNMTGVLFFDFVPDESLRFVLEKYDLVPRPAGVGISYAVAGEPSFGFGPYNLNFNNGTFGA